MPPRAEAQSSSSAGMTDFIKGPRSGPDPRGKLGALSLPKRQAKRVEGFKPKGPELVKGFTLKCKPKVRSISKGFKYGGGDAKSLRLGWARGGIAGGGNMDAGLDGHAG